MEKEQLLFLTRNFDSLTAEEASELISLKSEYPYCQLIHSLAARGAKDNTLKNADQELQLTAVYSTDRGILKSVMAAPRKVRRQNHLPSDKSGGFSPIPVQPTDDEQDLRGDDLRLEITHDLERLKKLKHDFEISFERFEGRALVDRHEDKRPKPPLEIVEPDSEELIKEIKSTKKKIKPEGAKQKEQFEIIDQFIKTQPTISSAKAKPLPASPPATDLTENEQAFGEHIISETLVDILLKQGKKDKALEVLKKLIWKFPQKKAYFAAQIEDLKK